MSVPIFRRIFIVWALILASEVLGAQKRLEPAGLELPQQTLIDLRIHYQQALSYLRAGKTQAYLKLKASLTQYPLYAYLEYEAYRRDLSQVTEAQIVKFTTDFSDTPMANRLYLAWLRQLAKDQQWTLFIKHYQSRTNTDSTSLQCLYHVAQLKTGRTKQAYKGARTLWLVGQSQPNECDPLFQSWQQSQHFASDLYWQRTRLALSNNNLSLARYLSKKLSSDHRAQIKLWESTLKNPKKLAKTHNYTPWSNFMAELVLKGLIRLVDIDQTEALALYQQYEPQFSLEQAHAFRHYYARYLSFHYDPDSIDHLNQADPDFQDIELIERRIRMALKRRDWPRVKRWIQTLPPVTQTDPQWQYWLNRAELALVTVQAQRDLLSALYLPSAFDDWRTNRHYLKTHFQLVSLSDPESNNALHDRLLNIRSSLKEIAQTRSFYGFLASQMLREPPNLNFTQSTVSDADLYHIQMHKGIQRARELYVLGQMPSARREWHFAVRSLSAKEKSIAAKLAHLWGWHSQAIHTAAKSDQLDALEIRFPQGFQETILTEAQKNNLPPDWVFALIRQESAFTPDAASGVGARGLMQLMPATAKFVARKNGLRYSGHSALLDPEKNIHYGTHYLADLLERFDGSTLLATAAYNAGPTRVKGWQPEDQAVIGDIWVETIPIKETREYVKNIATYQAIYRHHLGEAPMLSVGATLGH